MSFAAPGWLLLGGLCLLVTLLHTRRRPVVEVSSLELWRRLAATGATQPRWRPPRFTLLLLLQLLLVVLLTLALARPQLGAGANLVDHWLVLVDASSSMATQDGEGSRFEEALEELRHALEGLRNGADAEGPVLSLINVGPHADIVGVRLGTASEALRLLPGLELGGGGAAWDEAAALLPGLIVGDESVRLTVFTDGAGAEGATAALAERFPEVEPEVISVGTGVDNAGLTYVAVTPVDLEARRWHVTGTVRRFAAAPQPLALTVWFTPEGTEGALPWTERELVSKDGRVDFAFDLELSGTGLLELRLPDDALALDNGAQFWLRAAPRTVRVLQVGPDNPPLQRALEAVGESVGGIELFRANTLPGGSEAFDLVVIDRVGVPRHPGTHTLWLGGASSLGEEPFPLPDATPTGWLTDHSLSASVDWRAVGPTPAFLVPHLPGASVLLSASGDPLIQARTTGAGREVVVALDLSESPWTEELGFPVFIANVVRWAAPWHGDVQGQRCTVGEACPLEPRMLYRGATLHPTIGDGGAVTLPSPFVMPSPDAPPEEAWAPEEFTDFYPRQAGVYRTGEKGERLVVSPPVGAEESDTRLSATPGDEPEVAPRGWPLYRWLLLAALLVLGIEGWLAGRGADRFLRYRSLTRENPLATRQRTVLGLRVFSLLLVVLALFGVPWLLPHREQLLVLVVDDADLYAPDAQTRIDELLAGVARSTGRDERVEVVELGSTGNVLTDLNEPTQEPERNAPTGADLAATLDVAAGLLGDLGPGRIVVATGGAGARGEPARMLSELLARGTPVDVLPVGGMPTGEVLIGSLSLPSRLYGGELFTLQSDIYSSTSVPATVRVWREGVLEDEQTLGLRPGRNRLETRLSEEETGRHLYEVEVVAEGDGFAVNNRDGVIAEVLPKAEVALITPQPSQGGVLAEALRLQGMMVEMMSPTDAPFALDGLLGYDAVILANVPAIDLHSRQQETLETWVRDYGGGLLVLGGENAFGPGGYYQTALERVSPLSSRIPREAPKVALLFVLDRSGSMQQRVEGISRLDIAKRATVEAADLLHSESLLGVVVFDSEATTLLPLQGVERSGLERALEPLQPGGGTSLYPALVAAFEEMREVDAAARHIVVMTDGLSQPGAFDGLLDLMTRADITLSTVAIGQGADTRLLQNIARRGGGLSRHDRLSRPAEHPLSGGVDALEHPHRGRGLYPALAEP